MKTLFALVLLVSCGGDDDSSAPPPGPWPAAREEDPATQPLPEWTRSMRIWPFDILLPTMTDGEIEQRVDEAVSRGADTIIFYVESEHMFGTFVDEAGFAGILPLVETLTGAARERDLHTIVYVNGLEVMTRGAYDASCTPTGVPTMAALHPDWLQRDLDGQPIVFACQDSDWLEPDWEDAWVSPLSGYRELFRDRIRSLAGAGVDGVYIDATFLPGFQADEDHPRWGTTDDAFAAAFRERTGIDLPAAPDVGDDSFRAFLEFRHEVVADYLGDLAGTARELGLAAFWESSTNDTTESILLGNETAITGRRGLGFSPEVEPEGDWLAAFRMAKTARELNEERPMIYLGWPEDAEAADIELAIALAHSSTYYPTADIEVPEGAFEWMTELAPIFDRRIAYGGDVALVYSVRNKDYAPEEFFERYVDAFESLTERHVPFRVVTLEQLVAADLDGVGTVILPGLTGISDEEAELLRDRVVVPLGDVGTRDEQWQPRTEPLAFDDLGDVDDVAPVLPFSVSAPSGAFIEWYGARDGGEWMALFVVSPDPAGELSLSANGPLAATVHRHGADAESLRGSALTVPLTTRLTVVVVEPD